MASSSGEPSNKSIDASVGALVWVRRRNGSWWPGRIVGLDEVSEGCLVSSKTGTPVKLLGREDASIDWYNLEKSKRVKAFRCGEYDDCIEKAKATGVGLNKKGVKYARREDAILHALEIENALLGKDVTIYSRSEDSDLKHDILVKESPTLDDASNIGSDSLSAPDLSYSGMSFEESNLSRPSKVQTEQETSGQTPIESEDDGVKGSKRMRGLQDLGMGFVSDRKAIEPIQQDNGQLIEANGVNCMVNEGSISMNGVKGSTSYKRKRSQVAYLPEFSKKKNRRRQLTKVLESTTMLSVPVTCEEYSSSCVLLANNSESTGLSYENGVAVNGVHRTHDNGHVPDKMKKELSLLETPDNELYDVPLNAEDKSSAGFPSVDTNGTFGRTEVGILGRHSSQSSKVETLQPEGINGYCFFRDSSKEKSSLTSTWQSKGKRNSRHQNKNKRRVVHLQREYQNGVDVDRPLYTKSLLETEDRVNGIWDRTNHQQPRFTLPPSNQTSEYHPDGTLYDVELKVNAKSHRASSSDVPLVSLMSKLNRKAIVGHPLTVEALADGSVVNCPEIGQLRTRCLASKHGAKSKNGLLCKKMRKLSSLTGGGQRKEKPLVEKARSAVVACIPLRLVFSRLSEAVNGSLRHRLQSASAHT